MHWPAFLLLHPAGPVGASELHLMEEAAIAMGFVILFVFVLFAVAVVRFRDRPGRRAPYAPHFREHRWLEILWFVIPALILTVIAVPTVRQTYALASLPTAQDPVVVDVTSLDWKWLFEYPQQHIATVNYLEIPTGEPVLFELTANSPMNTFWIPQLGGMEYTMSGRVLPLWLEASKPGVYWGHSGNFSGIDYEEMFFRVKAVPPAEFARWAASVHATARPMTLADYRQLLRPGTTGEWTFGSYPASTFPKVPTGFTLSGGMYMVMHDNPANN
ncbi:MAG: cytochrome c oxidase subunit II [Actinomycetia bacterium]|nr:cytochrome c oxidase subunit II [Actinomycetes bacterium]